LFDDIIVVPATVDRYNTLNEFKHFFGHSKAGRSMSAIVEGKVTHFSGKQSNKQKVVYL